MLNKIKDYFYFRTLVAPTVIQLIHLALAVLILLAGIVVILHGKFFQGLWIIFGLLTMRIVCETMILLFKINNTLSEINNKLPAKNA